jgi:twinkle protein
MNYRHELQRLGITLESNGKQTCPECSNSRHDKTDKCLSVTYCHDGVLYNCHHCGWHGVVYYNTYKTADKSKIYVRPSKPEKSNNDLWLYTYFSGRKISANTLKQYDISANENNEIQIPYYKNGELVNIKYRTNLENGKKTFRQEKDAEKTFYGMDLVDKTKALIIVEGEMDVLALAEQGIYSVSVPQGGSDKKLECIENCFDFIEQFDEYIIAVDNDAVGDTLKNNLLLRLNKDKCSIVNWGKYKDANEALIAGEKLQDFIDNASLINPDGVVSYIDKFDSIYKSIFEEDKEFYSTGWQKLDKLIKIRLGYLMVVTGYPSRGKSTFVNNLLINLTKQYCFKHLIASFESTPESSYIELLEMYKQKPLSILKLNREEVFDDFETISEHFIRLDTGRQWTIDEIVEKTEMMVKRHGIKTLVIDPYNRLKNEFKDREDKYIGQILSKLCMLCKKLGILIVFVAHPKKPDDDEAPTMYAISGSGDWYNMADYGIIVHRERDEESKELKNEPQIIVAKIKNFSLGNPSGGVVTLKYNKDRRILEE